MEYICNICNFSSCKKYDYDRHAKTIKHINSCDNELVCYLCLNGFSCKKTLSSHKKKTCKGINYDKIMSEICNADVNPEEELKNKIIDLEKQILKEQYDKLLSENLMLKDKVTELKEDKDYFKDQLNKVNNTVENLSNFAYIKATYSNPTLFISLTDKQIMKIFLEMEKKNILSYKKKGYDDKLCYYKQMLHYYDNKKMDKFLTDILSIGYKNDANPEKQSVWSSDTSRLNYAITDKKKSVDLDSDDSDYDKEDNQVIWIKDKSGLKIKKTALSPLLDHSNTVLDEQLTSEELDIGERMKILEMKKLLKDQKFLNKINKGLSSELQLKR